MKIAPYLKAVVWTLGLAFLFALPSLPTRSWAQEHPKELTLKKAFEIALGQNPSIQGAEAAHEAARARLSLARSSFFPRLDLVETFSRTNSPPMVFTYKLGQEMFTEGDFAIDRLNDPDPRSNFQTRLILTQPVFNQGREFIEYKLSKLGEGVAFLDRNLVSQVVIYAVEEAFYQVLLAQETIEVLQSALKTAEAHEALANKRYEAGVALKSDVLAAQVQKTEAERQLLRAEGDLQIAMASLNQAMGVDQDTLWRLKPAQDSEDEVKGLDYWLQTAHTHRPEILQAQKGLEMAKLKAREARWRFLPSVNLQGIYESNAEDIGTADGDNWSIMAVASINLFNGFGDRARVRTAAAEEARAAAKARQVRDMVDLQVREAYFHLLTARKQLEVSKRAVERAKETLRILRSRYENGLALMVELLASDTALKEARVKEARARFDVRTALANLKYRTGKLDSKLEP